MDDEAKKALIEQAVQSHGLMVREWREDDDEGLVGVLGTFRVIEEDEDRGLYGGDEGPLEASVVGAAEYGNIRVSYSLTPEGQDGGNEVRDLMSVEEV